VVEGVGFEAGGGEGEALIWVKYVDGWKHGSGFNIEFDFVNS